MAGGACCCCIDYLRCCLLPFGRLEGVGVRPWLLAWQAAWLLASATFLLLVYRHEVRGVAVGGGVIETPPPTATPPPPPTITPTAGLLVVLVATSTPRPTSTPNLTPPPTPMVLPTPTPLPSCGPWLEAGRVCTMPEPAPTNDFLPEQP